MKAITQAIQVMLAPVKEIYDDAVPELDPERMHAVSDPEEYLRPEPDVVLEATGGLLCHQRLLLGYYEPMGETGKIVLCAGNLKDFFWGLMKKGFNDGLRFRKSDFNAAASLVAYKTYYHELFHYDADVIKSLFGSQYDCDKEEALAVAHSYRSLSAARKSYQQSMNPELFSHLMDHAFRYTSPGYRDWRNVNDDQAFKRALLRYINPANSNRLANNGVPMEDLLYGMLGSVKAGTALIEETVI